MGDKVGKFVFDTREEAEAYIVELKANGDTRDFIVVDDGFCYGVEESAASAARTFETEREAAW